MDERLMPGSKSTPSSPCRGRPRGGSLDLPARARNSPLNPALHLNESFESIHLSACLERDAALEENEKLKAKLAQLEQLQASPQATDPPAKSPQDSGKHAPVFNALTGEWMSPRS